MMALMFHVFVEGAKDASPAGVERLAAAMSEHYGLPVEDMRVRFKSGRFRVKANCDRATADQYKTDLEQLGAKVTVEAATAENSRPTPPAGFPAQRPQGVSLPPKTAPAEPAKPAQYASGLSAAFSGEAPAASLGALEGIDAGSLSLASVDGSDSAGAKVDAAFAPPDAAGLPASIGPAADKPEKKDAAKKAKPKDEPVDLFMPPDAEDAEMKVDVAADEVVHGARKRASTPPPVDAPPAAPAQRRSQPSMQAVNAPMATSVASSKSHPLADERTRFVAGVVLAILIGFVPAHFIASMREKSAFGAVDETVTTTQAAVTSMDDYNKLDQMREDALNRKKESRKSIAIMAFAIWAAVGGAVAYGWFRRIDWDRFE